MPYALTIEFHPEEAGYLALFSTLHGCHSWGNTHEDAVNNAEEALIGYLEALQKNGESVPEGDNLPNEASPAILVNLQNARTPSS